MKRKFVLSALLIICILSSCATIYRAKDWSDYGYSETQYAPDRVMVSFSGNESTSYEQVYDLALLRAAELAIRENYRYFVIIDNKDMTKQYTRTTPGSVTTVEETEKANTRDKDKKNDNKEVKTTTTTYTPPATYTKSKAATSIEVQFYNNKLNDNTFMYEAAFIYKSIKNKYEIE